MLEASKPHTVIVGLGETGFASARYCSINHIPYSIVDSREIPPKLAEFKALYPLVPVYTGGFPHEILSKAHTLIVSPGVSKDHPDIAKAVAANPTIDIIGDIELFARVNPAPVIAITGSNGKSTVTTLVGEMAKATGLRVGVGGNLGKPILSLLLEQYPLYVLELSSFQLETTYSLKPKVSTILNLVPDHMDRYPSLEAYYAAKYRIYNQCEHIVVNRDDNIVYNNVPKGIPSVSFGLSIPEENQYGLIEKDRQIWLAKGQNPLFPTSKLKLFGRHNIANCLAALALLECAGLGVPGLSGLPWDPVLSVLSTFTGLPHRCEWVRELNGVQWINDSKGTNVGATLAALQGLASDIPGKWILIAGGVSKNADFTPLNPLILKQCRQVILIGESAKELEGLWSSVVRCVHASDMPQAVQLAAKTAKPGDGVLLSPACASYDMFRNFEHRGDVFKGAVKAL